MQSQCAADMETLPAYDLSLLLAAHMLELPKRHNPEQVPEHINDQTTRISTLFPRSPGANAYLALHYTPLHVLLAVAGDSWVFNKKLPNAGVFAENKRMLSAWRCSSSASCAAVFASRALRDFLGLQDGIDSLNTRGRLECRDISDFWGIYACALICWAFGHVGKRTIISGRLSPSERAMSCILTTAKMEPDELQTSRGDALDGSHAVVALVWDLLDGDCLGGRNILFADAVGVLRKLHEVDNWSWF